jgi:U6 snRNA-associated Sm-like protein LSm7
MHEFESSSLAGVKARAFFFFCSLSFIHAHAHKFECRTVTGVLKGYDQLFNLVLDEVEEHIQGTDGQWAAIILPSVFPLPPSPHIDLTHVSLSFADPEPRTRTLGLTVLRGPTITLLSPVEGLEEISNPFIAQE